ncbi:hypothetical protein V6N13_017376 [Hibiscus sabdariffa]
MSLFEVTFSHFLGGQRKFDELLSGSTQGELISSLFFQRRWKGSAWRLLVAEYFDFDSGFWSIYCSVTAAADFLSSILFRETAVAPLS